MRRSILATRSALHKFVSGTRVVRAIREARVAVAADAHVTRDAIDETVGRYVCRERLWSAGAEELLAGRDEILGRAVWIHRVPPGTPRLGVERQNVARRTRLRVIDSVRHDGETFDVYEAPDGALLSAPQSWAAVRQWLPDLVTELSAATAEGTVPAVVARERLWAASDGSIRLLDFSVTGSAPETARVADAAAAQRALADILAGTLGRAEPLPISAAGFIENVRSGAFHAFEDLQAAAAAAVKSEPTLPPLRRMLVVLPVGGVFAFVMAAIFVAEYMMRANPSMEMLNSLLSRVTILEGQLSVAQVKRDLPRAADLGRRRDALLIYAGSRFDTLIADQRTWSGPVGVTARARAQRARQMALAAPPADRASAAIVDDIVRDVEGRLQRRRPPLIDLTLFAGGFVCAVLAALGVAAIALAAACRAPVAVRMVGGALATENGQMASRTRAGLRSAIAWSPVLLGAAIVWLARGRAGGDVVRGIAGAIAAAITVALGSAGIAASRFSLPDRLARTRIVPR